MEEQCGDEVLGRCISREHHSDLHFGMQRGPRNFHKITHPAPLRSAAPRLSLSYGQPDAVVLPALIGRLDDTDVVVRLAGHEELKLRTGRDFGYLPWGSAPERSEAISCWANPGWRGSHPARPRRGPERKSLPRPSPQVGSTRKPRENPGDGHEYQHDGPEFASCG